MKGKLKYKRLGKMKQQSPKLKQKKIKPKQQKIKQPNQWQINQVKNDFS